jgi:flagellar L-ring protein precursor FlgH
VIAYVLIGAAAPWAANAAGATSMKASAGMATTTTDNAAESTSTRALEEPPMFDGSTYRSLVAEDKALRVGDVLTVIVQEAASATSSADLRAQRDFTVSARAGTSSGEPHSASAGTASASDGAGRTERSGRLLAQLSVRVTDVNANGDLNVSGQQSLRINGEEQLITLSGTVRPRDITENNTVLSSRIADARIRFDGKGFVTDQSRPGWLARLFGFLGL